MNCTTLVILSGFILVLEEFLEFSIGYSHLSNRKTMYYQQVYNWHCCYTALLSQSFCQNWTASERFATLNRRGGFQALVYQDLERC